MGIRNLDAAGGTALRDSLLKDESFTYAHLVKFEKPLITTTGRSLQRAQDYVYLSDGSTDILFNDLSTPVNSSTSNGTQTYIANKLISVGTVSETTEARATSMSINVSAAALSTSLTDVVTFTTTTITGTKDFVDEGFREGDTLLITGGANNTKQVRVDRFELNNTRMVVSCVTNNLTAGSNQTITLSFNNPEVESILIDRTNGSSYARYINRDVFIYKAHINTETGAIIGKPYLLFKGIIASGKLKEDPSKSSIITWSVTSHWGDFARVSGRITADQNHRALDQDGVADPTAAIRPAYSTDLGFLHSEQAVNLVSTYQVMETKTKLKMKRKWWGGKSYSQEEYEVQVDREVDLRFNLSAKYLPVMYGVNKIDSIPIFVDTLADNSKKVFVAYAICEGQVGGLYDIFFDDTSSICVDANDFTTRGTQTANKTVDVTCMGRADRGDTITPQNIATATSVRANSTRRANGTRRWNGTGITDGAYHTAYNYNTPTTASTTSIGASPQGAGITHEKGTRFSNPIDVRMQFHSGKSNQKASSILLHNSSNFKIAQDYYTGSEVYWGANHQLLDTAYLVAEYTIGEGETTIPSLDFVVRGKGVECLNYDHSFAIDPDYSSSDAAITTFNIGQTVTAKFSAGTSIGSVVIADIYTLVDIDGVADHRFRFTSDASGAFDSFYIEDSSAAKIHFVTTDYAGHTGTVPETISEEVTAVSNPSSGIGTNVVLGNSDSSTQSAFDLSETFTFLEDMGYEIDIAALSAFIASISGNIISNVGESTDNASSLVGALAVPMQSVKLESDASGTANAYVGGEIELIHTYPDNSIEVQRRKIISYNNTHKIVGVDAPFEHAPMQNNTYKIFTSNRDIRVSTNPAMQLLDYLTNNRYGRGLDLDEDIDKESFFAAGRACDERSNVTLLTDAAPAVGSEYKFAHSGKTLWQGKVKTVSSAISVGTIGATDSSTDTQYSVEFEEVVGKLAHRWEDWKYFFTGELYYKEGRLHQHAGSAGLISYSPTASRRSALALTNLAGGSTLALDFNYAVVSGSIVHGNRFTSDGDPLVKTYKAEGSYLSGYSLYDSDDVKYWRYLGWDAQNQRHVTRHQTNTILDTSKSVFSNINSMLKHFNGILRYSNGKYSLDIKRKAQAASTITLDGVAHTVEIIEDDDIIGSITVEDAGQKGTFNQLDLTINDPQNRFEGRSIMMFNSDYLKEDRMVPKKGSMQTPYVTNYFNARINAKQYLDSSRHGLKINFTIAPKGVLLRAGDIIRLNYSRFGWSQKMFRIENLNFNENCLVQVTAKEHSDEGYLISAKPGQVILPPSAPGANMAVPSAVKLNTITATQNDRGGIELNWQNSDNFNSATYTAQIWKSSKDGSGNPVNNIASAIHIGSTTANTYTDTVIDEGQTSRYYWIRYEVLRTSQTTQTQQKIVFSNYEPSNSVASGSFVVGKTYNILNLGGLNQAAWNTTAGTSGVTYAAGSQFVAAVVGAANSSSTASTGGIEGKSDGAVDGISISLTNDNATVPINSSNALVFTNTGTTITALIGSSSLIYDDSSPFANSSFRVTGVAASGVTASSSTPTETTNAIQYHGITAISGDTGTLIFTIAVKNSLGVETTLTKVQTFNKGERGDQGPQGAQGPGGPQGAQGSAGAQGPTGPAGETGPQGPQGGPGAQGPSGPTGAVGPTGEDGDQGAQGPSGPTGSTGPAGEDGDQGAQGPSGPTGGVGPTGNQGGQGVAGPSGATGSTGPAGAQGAQGNQGPQGSGGVQGPTGAAGSAGSAGPDGFSAFLYYSGASKTVLSSSPSISAWSSGASYAIGSVVSYSSKVFASKSAHSGISTNPQSDTSRWVQVFADGLTAPSTMTKITPTFYNASGAYWFTVQNITANRWYANATQVSGGVTGVTHTIIGTATTVSNLSSGSFGAPLITEGQTGPTGQTGDQGSQGAQGPQGAQGAAGPTGNAGPTGPSGPQGAQGSQGATGPQGNVGDDGPTGSQGSQGATGPAGPTGNQGAQGAQGSQGATGSQGGVGEDGDQGAQGSQGVAGPQGGVGNTGGAGPTGPQGGTGPAGPQGAQGPAGPQGGTGTTGATGPTGSPGATIAFHTSGTSPASDSVKKSTIQALKSPAIAGDVYWHIPTDRAFLFSGSGTTFTEYQRVSKPGSSGSIQMDGTNGRINIYSGSTLRVRIGQL